MISEVGRWMTFVIKSLIHEENNKSDAHGETNANGEVAIFCAWVKTWETKKIGTNGDAIFESRLVRKYGSFK